MNDFPEKNQPDGTELPVVIGDTVEPVVMDGRLQHPAVADPGVADGSITPGPTVGEVGAPDATAPGLGDEGIVQQESEDPDAVPDTAGLFSTTIDDTEVTISGVAAQVTGRTPTETTATPERVNAGSDEPPEEPEPTEGRTPDHPEKADDPKPASSSSGDNNRGDKPPAPPEKPEIGGNPEGPGELPVAAARQLLREARSFQVGFAQDQDPETVPVIPDTPANDILVTKGLAAVLESTTDSAREGGEAPLDLAGTVQGALSDEAVKEAVDERLEEGLPVLTDNLWASMPARPISFHNHMVGRVVSEISGAGTNPFLSREDAEPLYRLLFGAVHLVAPEQTQAGYAQVFNDPALFREVIRRAFPIAEDYVTMQYNLALEAFPGRPMQEIEETIIELAEFYEIDAFDQDRDNALQVIDMMHRILGTPTIHQQADMVFEQERQRHISTRFMLQQVWPHQDFDDLGLREEEGLWLTGTNTAATAQEDANTRIPTEPRQESVIEARLAIARNPDTADFLTIDNAAAFMERATRIIAWVTDMDGHQVQYAGQALAHIAAGVRALPEGERQVIAKRSRSPEDRQRLAIAHEVEIYDSPNPFLENLNNADTLADYVRRVPHGGTERFWRDQDKVALVLALFRTEYANIFGVNTPPAEYYNDPVFVAATEVVTRAAAAVLSDRLDEYLEGR